MRYVAAVLGGLVVVTAAFAAPAPTLAADIPTTITVSLSTATAYPYELVRYTLTVSPVPPPNSHVVLSRRDAGGAQVTGLGGYLVGDSVSFVETIGSDLGTYSIVAMFDGVPGYAPSTSATQSLTVVDDPDDATPLTLGARRDDGFVIVPGVPFSLRANRPDAQGAGTQISFVEIVDGSEVPLGTEVVQAHNNFGVISYYAELGLDGQQAGVHTYVARYAGGGGENPGEATLDLPVQGAQTATWLTITPNPGAVGQPMTARAVLSGRSAGPRRTGTIVVTEVGSGQQIAVIDPGTNNFNKTFFPTQPGTFTYRATYSGDPNYGPSISPTVSATINADTVRATGVGVAYSTFYPVIDGHLDRNPIRGTRQEPASVVIRIYAPSGPLVRRVDLAQGNGFYSWNWNGRTAGGSLQPPGRYRIVQTLTDAQGIARAFSAYTTVSHKRLVYTTSTYTRNASVLSAQGHSGTGRVTVFSDGSVRIASGGSNGFAGVGWEFLLPQAQTYTAVSFWVRGMTQIPPAPMGVWDFSRCSYSADNDWSTSCFHRWQNIGYNDTWYGITMSPTMNRSGRVVRGTVVADWSETVRIYQVRVKVTYGILQ